MYKQHWEKIKAEFSDLKPAAWGHSTVIPEERRTIRLKSMRKSDAGATGLLAGWSSSGIIHIATPSHGTLSVTLAKVELLDESGTITAEAPLDMLGEPLVAGAFVAYSQGRYKQGHDLAVGRIIDFTDRGTIQIAAKVKNGQKVGNDWRGGPTLHTINPERCVKLPVDVARLTMAILTDFVSIDGRNG